uniref:PDZ domain-containing protein n=1 Tax=Wuchereria bancrofti TaxID=6293 RepID=A0AAF5PVH8_WUCBA
MNIANLFTTEFDEYHESEWQQEIRLEPDRSISGALAFRLTGSKTRGVFIQHVNQKSNQSKILYKGDQILKVNGVDVRRLTCDQIVNILRLAVYNNGYALVQVNRQIRLREDASDENGNLHNCYPVYNDDLTTNNYNNNNNNTLPISLSDMTGLNQSAIYARAVKSSFHYCDNLTEMECTQLVCFSEENDQQFSICTQQRKSSMFGYIKQLNDNEKECKYEKKCAQCSKYSTKWRWHIVKHRWATNAMKILPKSASDLFGLRIYQKAYYNLI